ncbi:unnamed protein product [Hymenolepis diminuta]|uniref:Uncharacterized protein n=1 Tax=Hymenolepis diminuta TaxID=6216 RepID=A0A564Y1J2_HYMDI|nr:unnamed protein product [Hymenolepis diminuta]
MKCEVIFNEITTVSVGYGDVCYISILGLDLNGMFNVLEPKFQSFAYSHVQIIETMKQFATVFENTMGKCTQTSASLFLK